MADQKQKPYAFYTQQVNQLRSTRHSCSWLASWSWGSSQASSSSGSQESSLSSSISWVTCRFSSSMKGTTSPAGFMHLWSWRLEASERPTYVPGHGLQSALLPSCLRVMGSSLPCSPPVYQCPSHWLWPPHPISKTRGWQTMACRTNPAPLLFFYIKFYWNIAMPICSWIVKGCFCAILAELSSCYKDQISCKGWNIYYLAEKVSQTLVKTIAMHRLLNQLPQWWKVESLNICAQI